MENNLENKQKFFALYWGQVVARYKSGLKSDVSSPIFMIEYLELTPLSSITDDDAIELYKSTLRKGEHLEGICLTVENHYQYGRSVILRHKGIICKVKGISDVDLSQKEADLLRSKGFAVPYLDLSVETLVEYGWIKLKTK